MWTHEATCLKLVVIRYVHLSYVLRIGKSTRVMPSFSITLQRKRNNASFHIFKENFMSKLETLSRSCKIPLTQTQTSFLPLWHRSCSSFTEKWFPEHLLLSFLIVLETKPDNTSSHFSVELYARVLYQPSPQTKSRSSLLAIFKKNIVEEQIGETCYIKPSFYVPSLNANVTTTWIGLTLTSSVPSFDQQAHTISINFYT